MLKAGSRERRYLVLEPSAKYAQDKTYFDHYYKWLEDNGAAHLMHYLLHLDISTFDPRRAPITDALREEKLSNLGLTDDFMYTQLLKDKPFKGMVRPAPSDVIVMFDDFLTNEDESLGSSQKRSMIGLMMKKYGMQSFGKRGRNQHYELPDIEVLRTRFAEQLGQTKEELF